MNNIITVKYNSRLSAFLLAEESNNITNNKLILEYKYKISSAKSNENKSDQAKIYTNTFETFKKGVLSYLKGRSEKTIKFNIEHLSLREQSFLAAYLYRLEKEGDGQDYSFEFDGKETKRDFYIIGFNPVFINIKFDNNVEFKLARELLPFISDLKKLEELYPEETEILIKHLAYHIEKPENTHENIYILTTNILAFLDDKKNKHLKDKLEYDYLQIAKNRFFDVAVQLMDDNKIEEAGVYWIKLLKDDNNCVSKYFKREGEVFCALFGKSEINDALSRQNRILYPFINRNKRTGMIDNICNWYLWQYNADAAIKIFFRQRKKVGSLNDNKTEKSSSDEKRSNKFINKIIEWLKKLKKEQACFANRLLDIVITCLEDRKSEKNLYPRINFTFITFIALVVLIVCVYACQYTYAFSIMIFLFSATIFSFLVFSLFNAKFFKIAFPKLIISLAGAWLTVILVTDEHWRSFILVTPIRAIVSGIFFIFFIYIYMRSKVEERTQANCPYFTRGSKIISLLLFAFVVSYSFGAISTTFMGNNFLLYTGAFDERQFHEDYRDLKPCLSNVFEKTIVTNAVTEVHIAGQKYDLWVIKKKSERDRELIESHVKNNSLPDLEKCTKHRIAVKLLFTHKYFFPWFVLYKSFSALLIGVLFSSFMDQKKPSESI